MSLPCVLCHGACGSAGYNLHCFTSRMTDEAVKRCLPGSEIIVTMKEISHSFRIVMIN